MKHAYSGLLALLLCGAVPACAQTPSTYYVDFENGRDTRNGRSPEQAWQHAPGDSAATGAAAGAQLVAGDVVQFKGGVRYRGSIGIRHSGTPEKPITYSGTGWGEGRAIIDGADPVLAVEPCPSQAACGGAGNWRKLQLVRFALPDTKEIKFYDAEGPLFLAQYPVPSDLFNSDNPREYVKTSREQVPEIAEGRLKNAELAALARAGGDYLVLNIWVRPNLITRRKVQAIEGDTILFDAEKLSLYKDRDGAAALAGSPHLLSEPGSYARINENSAVIFPRPNGGALAVGSGRTGFDTRSQSHIVISGFQIAHGTAASGERTKGLAIWSSTHSKAQNLTVKDNLIGPAVLKSGRGILSPSNIDGLLISGNRLDTIETGSGIRMGTRISNVRVIGNQFSRFGRTGLYMGGVKNAEVRGNIISEVKSVHGNGMSFYLSNQNIVIEGNCVYDTSRPITFHGVKKKEQKGMRHNLIIRNNIFITPPASQAAITSWGNQTNGVRIENNVAFGGRLGMLLHGKDVDVIVTGNRSNRIGARPFTPAAWVMRNNKEEKYSEWKKGKFTPTGCSIEAIGGTLTVTLEGAKLIPN